ncbi:hypothetical protein MAHJHV28_46810 [Mycobacterium avium subsp. hominissuis]
MTPVAITSAEDGAGWLAFFRDLVARGLSGVKLVEDRVQQGAHPRPRLRRNRHEIGRVVGSAPLPGRSGLVAAIGATLAGAAWQRCRTHYAANLMAVTPKSSWPWVRTHGHDDFGVTAMRLAA